MEQHQHSHHNASPGLSGLRKPNPAMGETGHDHHAMMTDNFRKRFYVVLALTIPVMLLSDMIQHWLDFHFSFPGSGYVLVGLATTIFIYGGYPFLNGLVKEVKRKDPGMMFLIGFAITVAYGYSLAVAFGLEGMDFFWELATLILIMLLGHWMEIKSISGASRELELLVKLMPSDAHLLHEDHLMDVSVDSLKSGDIILVKPGEKIPADGVVVDGSSYLNESMLTGESKPVNKMPGSRVVAGSLNGNGALKIKVNDSIENSYLFRVIQLVRDAQSSKSQTQLLANKAAKWLTILAIGSGIATFVYWINTEQSIEFALERMVTVIVICCPHALGLAVPLVVARSTALAARHGLLIKNRSAFENSRKITTVVFDKTGTLTEGKFQVTQVHTFDEFTEEEVLSIAASLEQNSEHPIALGIVEKAGETNIKLRNINNFQAITGKGIQATVEGKKCLVVSPGYVKEFFPDSGSEFSDKAQTTVYLIIDDRIAGWISLADKIRKESFDAIRTLEKAGIKSVLLTGDNSKVASAVSTELGMETFIAEVLPHQKLDHIKSLQAKGEFVAMTGDGVNDAPALAQADIGIAIGSGSDIAAETAGIILVNNNPKDVSNLVLFGKATFRKMVQNLVWATGYNVIALPLAAGILYEKGLLLSPALGAILMTLSTIIVAINASLLRIRSNE